MYFGGGPGLRLMRFRGVDVQLDFSVLIIMAIFIFPQASQFPREFPQWSSIEVWGAAILIGLLFVASILVHELSHAWVGMLLGAEVSSIRLFIFGGATYFTRKPVSEARNFLISIVGPLSNLALWAVFDRGLESSVYGTVWYVVCVYLSTANFLLAVFNALPGYPMDGGQALRSAIFWFTRNELLAALVVMVLGCLTGGLIGLWALDSLRNQDTVGLVFRGLVAFWIISGSIAQYNETKRLGPTTNGARPQPNPANSEGNAPPPPTGIRVGQVMSQPPYASTPDTTVEQFLQQTSNLDDKAWVPVLREGYLSGMLNRQLVRKTPKEELQTRKLEQVMLPRRSLPVLSAEDDLGVALPVVQANRGQPVPVLGPGGLFAGFLSYDNLKA